jgi:hypothetical protein
LLAPGSRVLWTSWMAPIFRSDPDCLYFVGSDCLRV